MNKINQILNLFFLFFLFVNHTECTDDTKSTTTTILTDNYRALVFDSLNALVQQAYDTYPNDKKRAYATIRQVEKTISDLPQDTSVADLYHRIGNFYNWVHEYAIALPYFDKGRAIRLLYLNTLHTDLIRSYIMVGSSEGMLGHYTSAIAHLDSALQKLTNSGSKDSILWAKTCLELCHCYTFISQEEEAETFLLRGLQYQNDNTQDMKAESYNVLGMLYARKGNYPQSIGNYQLFIQQKLLAKDTFNTDRGYCNMGNAYRLAEKCDSAKLVLAKSIDIYKQNTKKTNDNHAAVINAYNELAHCSMAQNKRKEAYLFYKKTLDLIQEKKLTSSEFTAFQSEAYIGLGDIAQKKDQFKDALQLYHRAVGLLIPELATSPIDVPPSVKKPLGSPMMAIDALSKKAHLIFKETQKNKTSLSVQKQYKTLAKAYYKCLDSLIMDLNSRYEEKGSKYNLIERSLSIYENALSLAIERGDTTQVLQYFGSNKALVLREALYDRSAKILAGISPKLFEKEKNIELEIAYWRQKIVEAPNKDSLNIAETAYNATKVQLHQLLLNANGKKDAQYINAKYLRTPPLSIDTIQAQLKPQMAMIEYFVGLENLFILTVSKNQCFWQRMPLPINLMDSISHFRNSFMDDAPQTQTDRQKTFVGLAPKFYNILLRSSIDSLNALRDTVTRLRIVPDGQLCYLPFNLLMDSTCEKWKNQRDAKGILHRPSFLMKKYAFSYDYASELMVNTDFKQKKEPHINVDKHIFGGFGIEYDNKTLQLMTNTKKRLEPLESAPKEVFAIQAQIGGDAFTDKWWQNIWSRQTSREAFMTKIKKQYSILHLSMHAVADDQNPLNYGLIFSKKDAEEKNVLTLGDIYTLDFNHNDLTVLSACQTASGKLYRGEGIISLTHALTYAGSKSIISTLWSVRATDMYRIMPVFYKNLQDGMDKDLALQKAQKEYYDTNEPDEPCHWAAPILMGSIENIAIQQTPPPYLQNKTLWVSTLVLGMLIGLLWQRKRGNSRY